RKVKLLKLTEGRTVPLNPPVSAASGDSCNIIDKLFDEGNDAEQEHFVERDADVLEETITKDVSEVAIKKTKKSKRKRKTTGDASASTFPPKKLREDYHAANFITGGKSLDTICSLIPEGSSVPSGIAEPRDDGLADSVYVVADTLVMTISITTTVSIDAFVVQVSKDKVRSGNLETFGDSASAGGAIMNAASSSKVNELTTSSDSFYASQDIDSETLHNIYVPKWKVANDSFLDDLYLYTEFNVGAARQMCLGAEARMRAEYTLEQKDHLEDNQLSIVEAVDAAKSTELRDLKERNFALEGEKDALSEKVATLESMTTLKETELASPTAQVAQLTFYLSGFQLSRDELSSKVDFLESERDRLADQSSSLESAFELFKERMEAMQDEQATIIGNRVAELDA
ncbi:hypothetical protein Tco_0204823, partial [Tanacetum coccineum]